MQISYIWLIYFMRKLRNKILSTCFEVIIILIYYEIIRDDWKSTRQHFFLNFIEGFLSFFFSKYQKIPYQRRSIHRYIIQFPSNKDKAVAKITVREFLVDSAPVHTTKYNLCPYKACILWFPPSFEILKVNRTHQFPPANQ